MVALLNDWCYQHPNLHSCKHLASWNTLDCLCQLPMAHTRWSLCNAVEHFLDFAQEPCNLGEACSYKDRIFLWDMSCKLKERIIFWVACVLFGLLIYLSRFFTQIRNLQNLNLHPVVNILPSLVLFVSSKPWFLSISSVSCITYSVPSNSVTSQKCVFCHFIEVLSSTLTEVVIHIEQ